MRWKHYFSGAKMRATMTADSCNRKWPGGGAKGKMVERPTTSLPPVQEITTFPTWELLFVSVPHECSYLSSKSLGFNQRAHGILSDQYRESK
jgi:hypothetical protein